MIRKTLQLIGLFTILLFLCSQTLLSYDKSKVTPSAEVSISKTKMRGIENIAGVIYYVEDDMQTITAYQKDEVKWKTNIIICYDKSKSGQQDIRFLKLEEKCLKVLFGEHRFAEIDFSSGKIVFTGSE